MYSIHTIYKCVYKSFSTMLDKGLQNNKKRDGAIGKYKLNKIGALNMK